VVHLCKTIGFAIYKSQAVLHFAIAIILHPDLGFLIIAVFALFGFLFGFVTGAWFVFSHEDPFALLAAIAVDPVNGVLAIQLPGLGKCDKNIEKEDQNKEEIFHDPVFKYILFLMQRRLAKKIQR
jgi:hypothetical protein